MIGERENYFECNKIKYKHKQYVRKYLTSDPLLISERLTIACIFFFMVVSTLCDFFPVGRYHIYFNFYSLISTNVFNVEPLTRESHLIRRGQKLRRLNLFLSPLWHSLCYGIILGNHVIIIHFCVKRTFL